MAFVLNCILGKGMLLFNKYYLEFLLNIIAGQKTVSSNPVLMVRFTCSNCGWDLSVEIMNKYIEKVKSIMYHVFVVAGNILYYTLLNQTVNIWIANNNRMQAIQYLYNNSRNHQTFPCTSYKIVGVFPRHENIWESVLVIWVMWKLKCL